MLQSVDIARLYDVCSVFVLVQVHSHIYIYIIYIFIWVHVNFGVCGNSFWTHEMGYGIQISQRYDLIS